MLGSLSFSAASFSNGYAKQKIDGEKQTVDRLSAYYDFLFILFYGINVTAITLSKRFRCIFLIDHSKYRVAIRAVEKRVFN